MPSSSISPCPSCPPHAAGGHGCAVYSSSVTDAQWAILEPLLPAPGSTAGRGGRPEKHCRRVIVDAILYIVGAVVSRGGNCRWSSRQPGRCRRSSPAGPAAGGGSASSTRCATDCGCGPGGTGARPRRSSTRRRYPPPTPCPDPAAAGMAPSRTNGVKRHIAVDVNGLLLAVVVTAASIQDRDAAHRLLAALRGSFSTIGLVWADGGYPGRLLIWAKDVLTLTMQIIKRIPGATGFHVRPRIWVVERSFAWINKHRRCVRDYETRPDHHEAMVHLAMITTMTRRLART